MPSIPPAGRSPAARARQELPVVDIRATAFHRWRTHCKWRVTFTAYEGADPHVDHAPSFPDAVHMARSWALQHHHGGLTPPGAGRPAPDVQDRGRSAAPETFGHGTTVAFG